jgi:hypothetical protein
MKLQSRAASHHGSAPLELIDGQVHPVPIEAEQSSLDPLAGDKSLEVLIVAVGQTEQRTVRACRV